jgi:DNA-binding NarL/FixJ family response regulator
MMPRLLLVDDHEVVRLGLRALLSAEADFDVVGEAGTGMEAVQAVEVLRPDVVLMDVRLPDESGIAACQQIRRHWPTVQVLILTSFADDDLVMEAINAGAAGYVLKQVGSDDLVRAVRAVALGDAVIDPAVTKRLLGRAHQQR